MPELNMFMGLIICLVVILGVLAAEVGIENVEDDGVDENGNGAGLAAHEDAAGAGREGEEEARAEEDEEDDGEEHSGGFLLKNRKN